MTEPLDQASGLAVADLVAIHQLLALYGHLVDDAKFTPVDSPAQQRLDEVFAPDGVFDVSTINGQRYVGIDAIRATFARPKPYHPPAHQATNAYVWRDGDVVRARSKVIIFGWTADVMLGEYRDVVVRTPSGWRIAERIVLTSFPPAESADGGARL